ncbi:MAG: hypothetical protein ABR592_04575 [Nitriliruptorales bacterium]
MSRSALIDAIRGGRAYVRALGVAASPQLEMTATTRDDQSGTFGCRLELAPDDPAEVKVVVKGGAGQILRVIRNGHELHTVRVASDEFEHLFAAYRVREEGPLGTWYRVETCDERSRTTIGNPIFLGAGHPPERPSVIARHPPTRRMRRNLAAVRSLGSLPYGS